MNNYEWDDPYYESDFQLQQDEMLEDNSDYEPLTEKFRVITFIKDLETNEVIRWCDEGFSEEWYSQEYFDWINGSTHRFPYLGC